MRLVVLVLLVFSLVEIEGAAVRRRRDAKAISDGTTWFSNFYKLFTNTDKKSAKLEPRKETPEEKPSAVEPPQQATSAEESMKDVETSSSTEYKPIETTGFFPELPVDKSAEPAPVTSGGTDVDDTEELTDKDKAPEGGRNADDPFGFPTFSAVEEPAAVVEPPTPTLEKEGEYSESAENSSKSSAAAEELPTAEALYWLKDTSDDSATAEFIKDLYPTNDEFFDNVFNSPAVKTASTFEDDSEWFNDFENEILFDTYGSKYYGKNAPVMPEIHEQESNILDLINNEKLPNLDILHTNAEVAESPILDLLNEESPVLNILNKKVDESPILDMHQPEEMSVPNILVNREEVGEPITEDDEDNILNEMIEEPWELPEEIMDHIHGHGHDHGPGQNYGHEEHGHGHHAEHGPSHIHDHDYSDHELELEDEESFKDMALEAEHKNNMKFRDLFNQIEKEIPNKEMHHSEEEVEDSMVRLAGLLKEDCITESGVIGECLTHELCDFQGGHSHSSCHQGLDYFGDLRTCCVFNSYCGYETNKMLTYLMNPDYPEVTNSSDDCVFRVELLPSVCQVRLDFLELALKPMEEGVCDDDNALHISSDDPSVNIPVKKLCGTVNKGSEDVLRTDNPHVYVHVDRDEPQLQGLPDFRPPNKQTATLKLNVRVKDFASRWNIRISQISCDGANLQAPTGCAQYYNTNAGNITSLNFQDGSYRKDLSMAACIKRDPTACGIEYTLKHLAVGDTRGVAGKLGYGLTCKDYLLVGGERTAFCGSINLPKKMIFPTFGPEYLYFHSDSNFTNKVDVGYDIEYRHLQDCTDVDFFRYPTKK